MNILTYANLLNVHCKIQDAVNENFGYSPDEPWFDALIQERNQLLLILKKEDPSFYEELLNTFN